ncbi:MAG: penicillin-binding transpeptidase domain-containing protein [Peptostreptococcales bacterium]
MNKWVKNRNNQILLLFLILFSALILRLFSLTVVQGEQWRNASDNIRVKQIYMPTLRGEIRDRYGRVLAGNKPSFVVQIVRNNLVDDKINDIAIELISILEANNETYTDNFPILIEEGNFKYTYDKEIQEWLIAYDIPVNYNATEAFDEIRRRYSIDDSLDRFDAQIELQNKYNIYPPISVRNMRYTRDLQKDIFLGQYKIDLSLSAKDAFKEFRRVFQIDDSYSDSEARKIMIIRNELESQGYRKYNPVKLGVGISQQTTIELEEKKMDLPGVEVIVEPIRYYPYDNLASHILGYLGRISEEEKDEYTSLGYLPSDFIGKQGIEKYAEPYLNGSYGITEVEVNASGQFIKVIDEKEPERGKNIYLTIDAELQQVAQNALEHALIELQRGGTFKSKWGDYRFSKAYKNATSGAVVAIDVKTGEILAEASYPDYNPNLFTLGISNKDWASLQDDNPRDPLSPVPLFDTATRTAVQPGSTLKMLVGLAAMDKGLSPYTRLYDGGAIMLGSKSFACSLWNNYRSSHGYVNLMEALEVSCNYYFYDIMSDYDFKRGVSLGTGLKPKDVMDLAEEMGLGQRTGIEISEVAAGVPSEEKNEEATKASLRRLLNNNPDYFGKELAKDEELLEKTIETIVSWIYENPTRGEIINRLTELNVPDENVYNLADIIKYSYFNRARWSTGDILNLAIGQGQHAYTPLQMANYIATLVNGGYRNEVTLIKGIEGEEAAQDKESKRIELKDYSNLDYIKKGMNLVTSGSRGTARGIFSNFPVEVGGKTGTAEVAGYIQPKDEVEYIKTYLRYINSSLSFSQVEAEMDRLLAESNRYNRITAVRQAVINLSKGRVTEARIDSFKQEYENFAWFVSFAPYDDPQIAVAVLLFQGGQGGFAAPIAREVMAEYLGLNDEYEEFYIENRHVK